MSAWDQGRVSCLVTWITLSDLGQLKRKFDTAGGLTMKNLTFWDPHATQAVLKQKAKTIVIQSDNLFRRYWGAKYEEGKTRSKAINAAVKVLLKEDATVADLAAANDESYRFFGEDR